MVKFAYYTSKSIFYKKKCKKYEFVLTITISFMLAQLSLLQLKKVGGVLSCSPFPFGTFEFAIIGNFIFLCRKGYGLVIEM